MYAAAVVPSTAVAIGSATDAVSLPYASTVYAVVLTVSDPAMDVRDAVLYAAAVTAVVIKSMVGFADIPPPSEII